jgi:hypothetical protein
MTKSKTKEDKEDSQKAIVIQYLTHFPFYKWAAKAAGISDDTLKRWRDADKTFADGCEIARSAAAGAWGAYASPEFMLKATDPETFAQPDKMEISGNVTINIDGIIGSQPSQLGKITTQTTNRITDTIKSSV